MVKTSIKVGYGTVSEIKLSIVIPLYNKHDEITRCLQSVFAQTVQSFEVIVIDDGSTDGSGDIVTEFACSRLRLLKQSNRGLAASRNRGVEEAAAELIAFLDADDEWFPGHVEQILQLVAQAPEAAVYCTAFWLDRGNGARRQVRLANKFVTPGKLIQDYFSIPNGKTLPSAMAIRKAAMLAVGGFRKMFGEDVDLLLRLAATHPIAYGSIATAVWHLDAHNRMCVDKEVADQLHQPGSLRESLHSIQNFSTASATSKSKAKQYVMARERKAILSTLLSGHREHAKFLLVTWLDEFGPFNQVQTRRLRKLLNAPVFVLKLLLGYRAVSTKVQAVFAYAVDWRSQRAVFKRG